MVILLFVYYEHEALTSLEMFFFWEIKKKLKQQLILEKIKNIIFDK